MDAGSKAPAPLGSDAFGGLGEAGVGDARRADLTSAGLWRPPWYLTNQRSACQHEGGPHIRGVVGSALALDPATQRVPVRGRTSHPRGCGVRLGTQPPTQRAPARGRIPQPRGCGIRPAWSGDGVGGPHIRGVVASALPTNSTTMERRRIGAQAIALLACPDQRGAR